MMAACLGMFLFFVSEVPRWKPILAVVAVVAAIQVAGAARLIRQDEYHKTYVPLIEAIKRNSPSNALVMSQGELWFGLLPIAPFCSTTDSASAEAVYAPTFSSWTRFFASCTKRTGKRTRPPLMRM